MKLVPAGWWWCLVGDGTGPHGEHFMSLNMVILPVSSLLVSLS